MLIISLCFFRKESAAVIVALFELNTPEFSMMLTVLPKSLMYFWEPTILDKNQYHKMPRTTMLQQALQCSLDELSANWSIRFHGCIFDTKQACSVRKTYIVHMQYVP